MSITDPAAITWNAVATNLNRINQDGYGSVFFGEAAAGQKMTATVKHTIPKSGEDGESHLFRLDVEEFDAGGILLRKNSAWLAIRTDDGVQNAAAAGYTAKALLAYLSASSYAVVDKLIARQQ